MLNKKSKQGDEGSMTMDARKQRILEAIVAIYSTGGEPVGSGEDAASVLHSNLL